MTPCRKHTAPTTPGMLAALCNAGFVSPTQTTREDGRAIPHVTESHSPDHVLTGASSDVWVRDVSHGCPSARSIALSNAGTMPWHGASE